jgi:hypothetical protein
VRAAAGYVARTAELLLVGSTRTGFITTAATTTTAAAIHTHTHTHTHAENIRRFECCEVNGRRVRRLSGWIVASRHSPRSLARAHLPHSSQT